MSWERGHLDEFTRAYVETAIWSSTTEDGEPMDKSYEVEDIDDDAMKQMIVDCKNFQNRAGDLILRDLKRAGHDFWLTRNGHGAGFWDGDWGDKDGKILTELAHSFGDVALYDGDDEKVYHFP